MMRMVDCETTCVKKKRPAQFIREKLVNLRLEKIKTKIKPIKFYGNNRRF